MFTYYLINQTTAKNLEVAKIIPVMGVQKNNQKHPVRLKIPKINVDALIEFVGVTPKGSMAVPSNITNVGLYSRGPKPGETGSAVISGHFNGANGEAGVFFDLNKLKEGDKVYIEDDKNVTATFVVKETKSYDPGYADEVFLRADGKYLNLITCEGSWDFSRKIYNKRLVVFTEEMPLDKYYK